MCLVFQVQGWGSPVKKVASPRLADRHRLLRQVWPGVVTEKKKKLQNNFVFRSEEREREEQMRLSLSLNICFYMVMRVAAWVPSGLSQRRHMWLTSGSTRGSCVDPPTIYWCTLSNPPPDSWTGSKSPDLRVQNLLTRSIFDQAFRALLVPCWANPGWAQRPILPNKPPVLFINAQIWAFSCLACFLHFFYLFFLFYYIFHKHL